MKYESRIWKSETKDVQVFADDRDAALKLVRESNPGFSANEVTEILDEDEPGETHTLAGHCEGCNLPLWEGDKYTEDFEEGILLCPECHP